MQHELIADIVGTVWQVCCQVGDTVPANETIMILESMKLEIPVSAEKDCRIVSLAIAKGDAVEEGQLLAVIEELQ